VELTGEQKQEQRSETTKEFFEVSVGKRASQQWWWRWTIDQANLRLSSTRERGFDPVRPLRRLDAQTANFSYQLPLPKPSLPLFGWLPGSAPASLEKMRLNFLPATMTYAASVNRQEQATLQRADADATFQEEFSLRETYTAKASPFSFLNGNYNLQLGRDLRKKFEPGKLSFGREVERVQKADVDFNPRLIKWLEQSYSFQANYEEINDPRRRRAQVLLDTLTGLPLQTRDIATKNNLSARLNLRLPALLQDLGAPGAKGQKKGGKGEKEKDIDPAEQAPQAPPAKEKPGNPFFLRRLLYFTGGFAEPFNATWRRNTDARNFNLIGRPSLFYQLGLEDSLRVGKASVGLTQQDQWSRNENLEIGTGLKLPLGFSLKADFRDQLTRRSGSTQNRLRVEQQQSFPMLRLTWGRADRLPYIQKLISSAQVNVSYEQSENSEGEGSLGPGDLIRRGESTELKASWSGRWKIGPSTKIEVARSKGEDFDFELDTRARADTVRPLRGSGSQEKGGTTFEVNYTLKPRNLPLFGNLRSNVDLKCEFGLESENRASATGSAPRATIAQTSKWKFSTSATYKFSESFRGRGLIRLENNRNELTDKTRKVREVSLSGTLFFR